MYCDNCVNFGTEICWVCHTEQGVPDKWKEQERTEEDAKD